MRTTRRNGGGYPGRGYGGHEGGPQSSRSQGDGRSSDLRDYPVEARYGPYFDRGGSRYYEDEAGDRYYAEDYEGRYDSRDQDNEREYYWREQQSRQETRRTAYLVLGGVCVAVIALLAVFALSGDDSSQTAQQVPGQPPQQAPQQAAPQAPQQAPAPAPGQAPQAPQPAPQQPVPAAPEGPRPGAPSAEQVEGLRADIDRQLAEIRQSINDLRLEIMSWFSNSSSQEGQESSP
jgi:hypothetical protein